MIRTVELIAKRKIQKSIPQERKDAYHVALVIEGGGMRGVAAGGMVSGLESLGLLNCFDSVHGSSAGAATGAYFVAGQARFGTSMFFEDLCGPEFINKKRILFFGPIMDTSFLVDKVMQSTKPLDFAALSTSKIPLHIVGTDIDTGQPVTRTHHDCYKAYREMLKASIAIPFISGGPKTIEGKRVMDGGLIQQIALRSAIDVGATHILVLQTRREDEQIRPPANWKTKLQALFLQLMYGGIIGRILLERSNTINAAVLDVRSGITSEVHCIDSISLDSSIDYIHRLTKSPKPLKDAAIKMEEKVNSVFSNLLGN